STACSWQYPPRRSSRSLSATSSGETETARTSPRTRAVTTSRFSKQIACTWAAMISSSRSMTWPVDPAALCLSSGTDSPRPRRSAYRSTNENDADASIGCSPLVLHRTARSAFDSQPSPRGPGLASLRTGAPVRADAPEHSFGVLDAEIERTVVLFGQAHDFDRACGDGSVVEPLHVAGGDVDRHRGHRSLRH